MLVDVGHLLPHNYIPHAPLVLTVTNVVDRSALSEDISMCIYNGPIDLLLLVKQALHVHIDCQSAEC